MSRTLKFIDIKAMTGIRISRLWVICAMGAVPVAHAQLLNDPTRPPAGIAAATPESSGAAASPVLQSVKISGSEKSAIIGGQTVKLGGKFGEARVVKITDSEVVLRSANGTETLRMYPDVSMKAVAPPPATPTPPARRTRKPAATIEGKQG